MDLQVDVPALTPREIMASERRGTESSAEVRARVLAARAVQLERFDGTGIHANAQMRLTELERHCRFATSGRALLEAAIERLGLSARAVHRCLRVARTVADLAGRTELAEADLAEAIQARETVRMKRGL